MIDDHIFRTDSSGLCIFIDVAGGAMRPCNEAAGRHTHRPEKKPVTLPNLLDGTEQFMALARQLDDEPVLADDCSDWSDRIRVLRYELLKEEYREYHDAEQENDVVEIVDGLLDVIVIAWGSLLAYVGPAKAKAAAAEVVRSNLDKVIGPGLPIFREDGKVLKPKGWTPPNIEGVLA